MAVRLNFTLPDIGPLGCSVLPQPAKSAISCLARLLCRCLHRPRMLTTRYVIFPHGVRLDRITRGENWPVDQQAAPWSHCITSCINETRVNPLPTSLGTEYRAAMTLSPICIIVWLFIEPVRLPPPGHQGQLLDSHICRPRLLPPPPILEFISCPSSATRACSADHYQTAIKN